MPIPVSSTFYAHVIGQPVYALYRVVQEDVAGYVVRPGRLTGIIDRGPAGRRYELDGELVPTEVVLIQYVTDIGAAIADWERAMAEPEASDPGASDYADPSEPVTVEPVTVPA